MKYLTSALVSIAALPLAAYASSASVYQNSTFTSSGSVFVSQYLIASSTGTSITTSTSSTCPLITDYLQIGGSNNPEQVKKLQAFLKVNEKLDVDVNGLFDTKTEAAVKAFQKKYMNDILGPWGATKASGIVHITTLKKINELACNEKVSLSENDKAAIQKFVTTNVPSSTTTQVDNNQMSSTATASTSDMIDVSSTSNSMIRRFAGFLRNLFR